MLAAWLPWYVPRLHRFISEKARWIHGRTMRAAISPTMRGCGFLIAADPGLLKAAIEGHDAAMITIPENVRGSLALHAA